MNQIWSTGVLIFLFCIPVITQLGLATERLQARSCEAHLVPIDDLENVVNAGSDLKAELRSQVRSVQVRMDSLVRAGLLPADDYLPWKDLKVESSSPVEWNDNDLFQHLTNQHLNTLAAEYVKNLGHHYLFEWMFKDSAFDSKLAKIRLFSYTLHLAKHHGTLDFVKDFRWGLYQKVLADSGKFTLEETAKRVQAMKRAQRRDLALETLFFSVIGFSGLHLLFPNDAPLVTAAAAGTVSLLVAGLRNSDNVALRVQDEMQRERREIWNGLFDDSEAGKKARENYLKLFQPEGSGVTYPMNANLQELRLMVDTWRWLKLSTLSNLLAIKRAVPVTASSARPTETLILDVRIAASRFFDQMVYTSGLDREVVVQTREIIANFPDYQGAEPETKQLLERLFAEISQDQTLVQIAEQRVQILSEKLKRNPPETQADLRQLLDSLLDGLVRDFP